MASSRKNWSLKSEGGFQLLNPDGLVVKLHYRKVEELLLAISNCDFPGISRDELSLQLWPLSNLKCRRENLRQALGHLRRALPEGAVIATRSACRLSSSFFQELGRASPTGLSKGSSGRGTTAISAFGTMLGWHAANEPERVFDVLRSNMEFASSLIPSECLHAISPAIARLSVNDPNRKWAYFWRGSAAFLRGNLRKARPLLRAAIRLGLVEKDELLISEGIYRLGICEILMGHPAAAINLCFRAKTALSTGRSLNSCKLEHVQAMALMHQGREHETLRRFDEISGYSVETTLEHALHEALRALFLATSGNFQGALKTNESPMICAIEAGSIGIEAVCRLTAGYVESRTEPKSAIRSLTSLIQFCNSQEQSPRRHLRPGILILRLLEGGSYIRSDPTARIGGSDPS